MIMKENTNKFHQTEISWSLLNNIRLYLDLRKYANGPSVPTVLYGAHKLPGGNKHYHIYPPLAPIDTTIGQYHNFKNLQSQLAVCYSWKVFKVNTSLHGPYIGMNKSADQHPQLGWIFHLNSEIPILRVYAPEIHQLSTDCMLLENLNSWDVTELCTICLLDLEVNHNYKRLRRYSIRAEFNHRQIDS